MSRVEKDRYNSLVANLDKIAANATNAPPARAMVVADLPEPYQPHIFHRGNPSRPGEAVPRAFPRVLSGGEPRVSSTADFGTRSDPPTHPELLDWLASDFIRSGWSVKHLHRVIVLSSAYQQASSAPRSEDPENKLLSHFARRRL